MSIESLFRHKLFSLHPLARCTRLSQRRVRLQATTVTVCQPSTEPPSPQGDAKRRQSTKKNINNKNNSNKSKNNGVKLDKRPNKTNNHNTSGNGTPAIIIEKTSERNPPNASYMDAHDADDEESFNTDELPFQTSAPDYSDYVTFDPDPEGHKAGFIAIIGRPNAGKSTLLNALLGQKLSIVTEKAQTTRHRILGIWSEQFHQAVFLDTPGIIVNRKDELEERMMGAVDQAVKDADALLAIIDVSRRPQDDLAMLQPGEDWKGPPMAIILNKCDLLPVENVEELEEWFKTNSNADVVVSTSALHGHNVDAIAQWVVDRLPEGPSLYPKDTIADASERFFVSEIIRKQVFLQYQQEIPYQVAVQVTEFKERRPPAKCLIRANVVVEKERHKGILVGAGGAAIKSLSRAARVEIEEFLEREIFLDLSVKVAEGWRGDASQLEALGY